MKYILMLLILVLFGCSETKFHHNDIVYVKSGFYLGCMGHLEGASRGFFGEHRYHVKLNSEGCDDYEYFDEVELERMDCKKVDSIFKCKRIGVENDK